MAETVTITVAALVHCQWQLQSNIVSAGVAAVAVTAVAAVIAVVIACSSSIWQHQWWRQQEEQQQHCGSSSGISDGKSSSYSGYDYVWWIRALLLLIVFVADCVCLVLELSFLPRCCTLLQPKVAMQVPLFSFLSSLSAVVRVMVVVGTYSWPFLAEELKGTITFKLQTQWLLIFNY